MTWMRYGILAAAASGMFLGSPARSAAASQAARARSDSGAYRVRVDPTDIVVRDLGGRIAFSAKSFAGAERQALDALLGADLKTVHHRFAVVSLVGPLLAIRDETSLNDGAPTPSGSARLWTIDLRRPTTYRFDKVEPLRPLSGDATLLDLRSFFPIPVLARAIGATPLGARGPGSPANRDLRYVLSDLTRRGQTDGHCFGAATDVLSSFAITGRSKAGWSVELGLPGQATCRAELTSLAINLPDNADLAKLIGRGALVDMKSSRQTVDIGD